MEDYPTVTPDRERTQVLLAAIVARLKRMVQAGMACPPVPVQNVGDDRVRLGIESLFAQDVKVNPATNVLVYYHKYRLFIDNDTCCYK